ncbi:MAG: CPBP family intramembrane metalloprotease [Planctomycetes bacterium]|nr:CPBP family intramembrane metalloprotease [Planctomycetota bacterium]
MGDARVAATAMFFFAILRRFQAPISILSWVALAVAAVAVGWGLHWDVGRWSTLGLRRFPRIASILTAAAIPAGIGLGIAFRHHAGMTIVPLRLGLFAVPAVLIGATEELLYRGFIQGRARRMGVPASIVFAAVMHTIYKAALFFRAPVPVDVMSLAVWTLLVGIAFGAARARSDSIVPPLVAHACFDLVAYGDLAYAPWWVWS